MNKFTYLAGLALLSVTHAAQAEITNNVSTCAEFKTAYESAQSIYLSNDLDCDGMTLNQQTRLPLVIDGNRHTVSNIHVVTPYSGFLNGYGTTKDIQFDGVYLTRTSTSNSFSFDLLARIFAPEGYIKNVVVKNITTDEPLKSVIGSVQGVIDGLKVKLRGNTLNPKTGFFSSAAIRKATLSDITVIGGQLEYASNAAISLLSYNIQDSNITNVTFRGQKNNSDDDFALLSNYLKNNYINGYTIKNLKYNPLANNYLIGQAENKFGYANRVTNYRHNLWSDIDEPLFSLFKFPDDESENLYEITGEGELTMIPAQCSPYLKHDFYYVPYRKNSDI